MIGGAPSDVGIGLGAPVEQARTFTISGVTRDANSNALGGCNVDVFNKITREFVGNATSNADGTFTVNIADVVQPDGTDGVFFAVFYKAGAPDVAGTTVNTLTVTRG